MSGLEHILPLSGVVREHLEAQDFALVWPQSVADALAEPVEDILLALGVLERQGALTSRASVKCPEEHSWSGPTAAVPASCPVCGARHGDDTFVEILFERKKKAPPRPRRRSLGGRWRSP